MTELLRFLRNSVRGRLACLVLAITLPAACFVALLVAQAYRSEREAVTRHLLGRAHAIAAVVDSQIAETEWLLKGLAIARTLETGDLAGFEQRLRGLKLSDGSWLVLLDATGQQLMNTRVAAGAALPRQTLDGEFLAAVGRGETYVSNVIGGDSERPVMFVALPIMQGGRLRYVLCNVIAATAFAQRLEVDRLTSGIVLSVLDRTGTIAVRRPNGERFVGRPAMPDIVEATLGAPEGVKPSVTLEGTKVVAVHSRAQRTGWSVALGAPYAELYASARRLLAAGLIVAAVLMSVAIFMAVWIGRALVRGVDALVSETDALGRGVVTDAPSSGLQETDYIAAAMRKSAQRLAERDRDNAALNVALQRELENQKRSEEAARQLAAIVESSADAIVSKDLNGIVTSWNGAAEQVFGYTAAEMMGKPILTLLPPDRSQEESHILGQIKAGERVAHFETVRRRKDGTLVPVSLTVSPVRARDGEIVGASKIARDISQRKRAEAQQHALFELMRAVNCAAALEEIYDAAIDAIIRCHETDRAAILLFDAGGVMRFRAWRGLSEDYRRAVEGHSPWNATDAKPAPLWIEDMARATVDPTLRRAIEAEGIRALMFVPVTYEGRLLGKFMLYFNTPRHFSAAELRPIEAIASQLAFAIERQRGAEALEALVDERTASLRQAVAQMEEFSYSVSHDLRAPTRAMCGYAEAILEDHGANLDDTARDLLTRILRNSQRMDRLIQDLLTYSRISRREVQLEPVSLDKLMREVMQQYPDLREERADITIDGPLPVVIGHEPSLMQVCSNLLTNAVKFVAPRTRPQVRVTCAPQAGGAVRLLVRDNGIGIKPDSQSRLFRMFERVHPEKHYDGTGIGLAIVRKAIERMNGTVGVESDGATGCTFWFELPVAVSAAEKIPVGERAQIEV